ncbi:MAG: LamG domain-containing protein, partial [Bacteroidales bacterium]|nr:LamG domain-containing protein [Bacteroidales bacterium]
VEFVKSKKAGFSIRSQQKQTTGYSISFWIKDFSDGKICSSGDMNMKLVCSATGYLQLLIKRRTGLYDGKTGMPEVRTFTLDFDDIVDYMYNGWHLMTLLYELKTNRYYLYINGKLSGSHSANLEIKGDNWQCTEWTFGSTWRDGNYIDMKLDNIRLYSRALTAEDIAEIYEEEKSLQSENIQL